MVEVRTKTAETDRSSTTQQPERDVHEKYKFLCNEKLDFDN
jgi:hypothetical protein